MIAKIILVVLFSLVTFISFFTYLIDLIPKNLDDRNVGAVIWISFIITVVLCKILLFK